MTTSPDAWVYGDWAPDPDQHDLVGLKANWIVRQLPRAPKQRILDYGCGEGKHLALVARLRPDAVLVGVDIREPHNSVGGFQFRRLGKEGSLDFEDESFDVVISSDTLEHVASIEHSLDEIRRVLRTEGSFIGFVPLEGGCSPHAFFRLFDRDLYKHTKDHVRSLTKRQMGDLLRARFRIARFEYSYHTIGASLDAAFFASFKLPGIGRKIEAFWRGSENPCYRTIDHKRPSLLGRLTTTADKIAYYESRLLCNVPVGGFGLHFHVQKSGPRAEEHPASAMMMDPCEP